MVILRFAGGLHPMLTLKVQAWGKELLARRQDSVLFKGFTLQNSAACPGYRVLMVLRHMQERRPSTEMGKEVSLLLLTQDV